MKSIAALLSCLALTAVSVQAHLNVVLTNDDGFGSANIRAVYNELVKQNHSVLIVGPADQQSGKGGVSRQHSPRVGLETKRAGLTVSGLSHGLV